ncbi:flagellar basal-body MS-ring/collar protein FliF [Albidovulum sp.]
MPQIAAVWQNLDNRRRFIVIVASMAMFAAVLTLARVATKPGMALLYAGIEGTQAGQVLAALDGLGATYEVRGTAIYVEADRRDALRMQLAAEGLPANAVGGYEILDSLTGFGTTSQMFDAAYLRAKEGELARTIMALPSIRSARVHIADTRSRGLLPGREPSASVAVVTKAEGLTPAHAKALRYLVASAVPGLAPDHVAVIDGEGRLIEGGEDATAAAATDRAELLRRNVERLLEARVGYGNAVVEVAVETVTEREAITERRFDPEGRVAISTDTEERSTSSSGAASGAVTVASNLPTGNAGGSGGSSQSQNSESRERTNFEVSETRRELVRSPGAIRRITVAALVDGITRTSASGETVKEPRSQEELDALKELIAASVGFDAGRGDVISVKSMEFEPVVPAAEAAATSLLPPLAIDVMTLIQLAVLAVVSLILGLFVVRPILLHRPQSAARLPAPARAAGDAAGEEGPAAALTGEIDDGDSLPEGLPVVAARSKGESLGEPADPVARLRRLIDERQQETVEILRGWMEDAEEEAG